MDESLGRWGEIGDIIPQLNQNTKKTATRLTSIKYATLPCLSISDCRNG